MKAEEPFTLGCPVPLGRHQSGAGLSPSCLSPFPSRGHGSGGIIMVDISFGWILTLCQTLNTFFSFNDHNNPAK